MACGCSGGKLAGVPQAVVNYNVLPNENQVRGWWTTVEDARVDWQGPSTTRYARNVRQKFILLKVDADHWQAQGVLGIEGVDTPPGWVG